MCRGQDSQAESREKMVYQQKTTLAQVPPIPNPATLNKQRPDPHR